VNGGLITNSEGEIVRFISMARDITERKAVQDSLLESEDRYNSFINNNIDRIFVKDENCRYLIVNDAMADFFGKTKEEILNKTDRELADGKLIYPSGSSDLRALESKNAFVVEEKLGDRIYETIKFPMQLKNQRTGIGGIMRDITERKMAEERLNYVARLYALLSQINQSIVRIKSIDELFEMTCNMAIEFGQFHMCWIGFYDETEEMIKPVSCAGHNEGYVESLHIYPYRNPRGKGPTGRAFLEGMVVASNNIAVDPKMKLWRDEALKRGYRSLLSTPLLRKGKPMGTLTVYAVEVNFFDDEEQKLLQEIGIDISYAIDAIDSENERKAAEEAVIRSEAKYRDFVENSPEAIAIYADNVVTYVNKECLRLMRAESKDQLIGVCMSLILFIPITDKSLLSG
jgi:PAS domain S-box-containing protein